jgi:hypothetical protein
VQYLHEPLARVNGIVDKEWCVNQLANLGTLRNQFSNIGKLVQDLDMAQQ